MDNKRVHVLNVSEIETYANKIVEQARHVAAIAIAINEKIDRGEPLSRSEIQLRDVSGWFVCEPGTQRRLTVTITDPGIAAFVQQMAFSDISPLPGMDILEVGLVSPEEQQRADTANVLERLAIALTDPNTSSVISELLAGNLDRTALDDLQQILS